MTACRNHTHDSGGCKRFGGRLRGAPARAPWQVSREASPHCETVVRAPASSDPRGALREGCNGREAEPFSGLIQAMPAKESLSERHESMRCPGPWTRPATGPVVFPDSEIRSNALGDDGIFSRNLDPRPPILKVRLKSPRRRSSWPMSWLSARGCPSRHTLAAYARLPRPDRCCRGSGSRRPR